MHEHFNQEINTEARKNYKKRNRTPQQQEEKLCKNGTADGSFWSDPESGRRHKNGLKIKIPCYSRLRKCSWLVGPLLLEPGPVEYSPAGMMIVERSRLMIPSNPLAHGCLDSAGQQQTSSQIGFSCVGSPSEQSKCN